MTPGELFIINDSLAPACFAPAFPKTAPGPECPSHPELHAGNKMSTVDPPKFPAGEYVPAGCRNQQEKSALIESLERFSTASMPVVVRQLTIDGQSYFYAVNASPWPTTLSNRHPEQRASFAARCPSPQPRPSRRFVRLLARSIERRDTSTHLLTAGTEVNASRSRPGR